MFCPMLVRLCVAILAAAAIPSQTYLVDAANGPGTDFTSVDMALATVPDGSTVLVMSGTYIVNSTVTGKGLTILGTGTPPVFIGFLGFNSLLANQSVVIKGIKPGLGFPCYLTLQSCLGRVHLEDCGDASSSGSLTTSSCAQVSVVRSTFNSGGAFTGSDVCCTDTQFKSVGFSGGGPGLKISGGRTRLVRCSATGGATLPTSPPFFPAIQMSGGDLAIHGSGTLTGGGNGTAPAVSGFGTLRMTPGVSFVGTLIPFATIDEGWTTSTVAPLGGVVTAKLEGSANLFGGLVFGFPQAPATLPDLGEELWVSPLGFAITAQLGTPLTYWLSVPNDPALRGWLLGWQGVTFSPAGTVLTNPAWFCVQ